MPRKRKGPKREPSEAAAALHLDAALAHLVPNRNATDPAPIISVNVPAAAAAAAAAAVTAAPGPDNEHQDNIGSAAAPDQRSAPSNKRPRHESRPTDQRTDRPTTTNTASTTTNLSEAATNTAPLTSTLAPITARAPVPPPAPTLANAPAPAPAQSARTASSERQIRHTSQPRASSSSSSTPSRQASAAPPRRNAPNVKPRRMGNCLYTPISQVRDGEKASIIGVVVAAGDPRRSSSGTRDLSIKITIADASCLSGTGYAKELTRSLTVMLFAAQNERIPHNIAPGHIFVVRSVQIQMFSGKPQAVGKSAGAWSWAVYNPVSGDVKASGNFPLVSHTPPECSVEEMEHVRDLSNWYSELQGVDANVVTRSSRPILKLQDLTENLFFDTVVEVLKVYTHTVAPDLYVTDYTNHTLFYRGNDKYLRIDSGIPYPDEADGWGHVFQISLWDSHATIAEGLKTGDVIRIQNVRAKRNPRGLLTGGLGSSTDSGIKIRTLKPTDEARIELEQRKSRFMQTLFDAEDEAFADQVERQLSQNSEQRQPDHVPEQPTKQPTVSRSAEMQGSEVSLEHEHERQAQTPARASAVAAPTATSQESDTSALQIRAPVVKPEPRVDESPSSATPIQPFPTPAQRHLKAVQVTPSRTAGVAPMAPGDDESGSSPSDAKPARRLISGGGCGPALRSGQTEAGKTTPHPDTDSSHHPHGDDADAVPTRPLIRCTAPATIPLTPLSTLQTTSLCPGMYKVQARIISTHPGRVESWARVECAPCRRLLPLDQRFCIKCADEDGVGLSYCLRFAVMLEETDAEACVRGRLASRSVDQDLVGQGREGGRIRIPLLFHGKSAEALLSSIDPKRLFNSDRTAIKSLRRFQTRLLNPPNKLSSAETTLAVYSFPSKEAGVTVRRFAALRQLNLLDDPTALLP
ncbi:hypothetical protein BCV70DRAFT_198349 [Testicularia cyperi]|uniref:Protection of telomeres protein 1 n=1 Tax=Testicularia cyperi TaxID=1882483 RepID=A0A317XXJ9_9BASI|nr:hypothetical protein BCV70DRAFT_198349 [Testicularia cyperi]